MRRNFTNAEKLKAKAMKEIFNGSGRISRDKNSLGHLFFNYSIMLNPKLFPSIQPGEEFTLEEILEDTYE